RAAQIGSPCPRRRSSSYRRPQAGAAIPRHEPRPMTTASWHLASSRLRQTGPFFDDDGGLVPPRMAGLAGAVCLVALLLYSRAENFARGEVELELETSAVTTDRGVLPYMLHMPRLTRRMSALMHA
ncbi:uncharacterized protein L969DRAFT_52394, partial [Mixia osmundae IAM 14324]